MKKTLWYALAAGLLISAGCRKSEDGSAEMMPSDEVVEKSQAVAVKTSEKAEKVAEEVAAKTEAAVAALNVRAEDVMADLNQSVEQIKEKVAGFDKTRLLAYADQYKTLLLEKKDQIAALTEQVKELPVTELVGEKAKELKSRLSEYTDEFSALKDRYTIYLDKLKSFGVDLSDYGL